MNAECGPGAQGENSGWGWSGGHQGFAGLSQDWAPGAGRLLLSPHGRESLLHPRLLSLAEVVVPFRLSLTVLEAGTESGSKSHRWLQGGGGHLQAQAPFLCQPSRPLMLQNSCSSFSSDGTVKEVEGVAWQADPNEPAKLHVKLNWCKWTGAGVSHPVGLKQHNKVCLQGHLPDQKCDSRAPLPRASTSLGRQCNRMASTIMERWGGGQVWLPGRAGWSPDASDLRQSVSVNYWILYVLCIVYIYELPSP